MSWHYSQEPAAEFSVESYLAGWLVVSQYLLWALAIIVALHTASFRSGLLDGRNMRQPLFPNCKS